MKQRQNTVCQNQFSSRDIGGIKIYFKGKLLYMSLKPWIAQFVSAKSSQNNFPNKEC